MARSEQFHSHENSSPSDILVPRDFAINLDSELNFATTSQYPGYPIPAQRLHMTVPEIEAWKSHGGRTADLPEGPYIVMNHPNYLRGIAKGTALIDDGQMDFSEHLFVPTADPLGYQRDERGIPIRPNDELFLQKGAVEGIGFYRTYGPNLTADPVVFRQKDEKLQVLTIERQDTGVIALPGGMQDPHEPSISTATRELLEEANIDLRDTPTEIVHQGIVWSDTRSTRHAWPETTVVMILPDPSLTDALTPEAGDDARSATWTDVNKENLDKVFTSHASYIRLSVLAWQKQTGLTVKNNGTL